MKLLLVGINSKYIHSNPALYYLKSYAQKHSAEPERMAQMIEIREYTINQELSDIISDIYESRAETVCISCYIWNISFVERIVGNLKKVRPSVDIWLGGPEVSFDSRCVLERFPGLRGIMAGEGEKVFSELCEAYFCGKQDSLGEILKAEQCLKMDEIPFPYENGADCAEEEMGFQTFKNRIIYYESSRGCPFSCSYCLSSVDRQVRFRSLSLVEKELQRFLDAGVPQVKFVDRTFNCSREHTRGILEYIKAHDNGVTNFHFEIAAELLDASEIELLGSLRCGQVQLEIGVQTVNPKTLEAINRKSDIDNLTKIVERLLSTKNMHIHLDLIAGLPFENLVSFRNSFNRVYAMHGNQLQLGFLKVLKGSPMYDRTAEYGLVYTAEPPYEILSTNWLSYEDVLELKRVENMLEVYYNSLQFMHTIKYIEERVGYDMYDTYLDIADYYKRNGLDKISHSRYDRYRIMRDWWLEKYPEDTAAFTEKLLTDLYLRDNVKSRPSYGENGTVGNELFRTFFESRKYEQYLSGYAAYTPAQVSRMVHMERTSEGYFLFDYLHRDAVTGAAALIKVEV